MYSVTRRYHVDPANVAEIVRRAEEGFVPIISAVPGFISYSMVDFGGGNVATMSVFQDQTAADESSSRAATWVRANLAALAPNPPQVLPAAVLLRDATADPAGYGVVRLYDGVDPAKVDEIVRRVREGLLPIMRGVPGYVSYTAVDAGDGVVGSASTFADQAAAEESNRRAAAWVRANLVPLLPNPPRVETGRVLLRHSTD